MKTGQRYTPRASEIEPPQITPLRYTPLPPSYPYVSTPYPQGAKPTYPYPLPLIDDLGKVGCIQRVGVSQGDGAFVVERRLFSWQ
jgi:hypothetical protein